MTSPLRRPPSLHTPEKGFVVTCPVEVFPEVDAFWAFATYSYGEITGVAGEVDRVGHGPVLQAY